MGVPLTHHVVDDDEEILVRIAELVHLGLAPVPAAEGAHARVEPRGQAPRRCDHGVAARRVVVERPAQLRPRLDHEAEVVRVRSRCLQLREACPPFAGEFQCRWVDEGCSGMLLRESRRVLDLSLAEKVQAAWEKSRCPETCVGVDVFGSAWFRVFGEVRRWLVLSLKSASVAVACVLNILHSRPCLQPSKSLQ